jgi:hypothetical protein
VTTPEKPSYSDRIKTSLLAVGRAADVMTRDAPPRVRPFLRAAFVGSVSLMVAVTVPLWPLIWWRQRVWFKKHTEKVEPVSNLENHARRVWAEDSPQKATDLIRDVFDRCRSSRNGIVVQPFGAFAWSVCGDTLGDLLYRFEAQAGHWDKALRVAEVLAEERRDSEAIFPTWVLSQAKCLVRLGREAEAIALLMAHRDIYNVNAPVNQYLDEVRAGRG